MSWKTSSQTSVSSIHSSLQSLHSRQVSNSSINDHRRLVDQFYSSDVKDSGGNFNPRTNLRGFNDSKINHAKSGQMEFLAVGASGSSAVLGSSGSNTQNNSKNSDDNSDNGYNDKELISRINDIQTGIMQKISDVINDTQEKYEYDHSEMKGLNREIQSLSKKIKNCILIIDELINKIETKFRKLLYEFLNNFLKYLKILDVLQNKLNDQNIKLKKHKKILFKLNDKISTIESMNDKNLELIKIRNKWIMITLAILTITFIVYFLIR